MATVYYDVSPLALTTDDTTDCAGKVKTTSAGLNMIAKRVIKNGTEYTEKAVISLFGLSEQAIRELVCEGYTVTTENAIYMPTVTGKFDATGAYDASVNSFTCAINPTKTFKAELAEVTPVFSGNILTSGGARISIITDSYTGKTDGTITPSQNITVTGVKIKCVNSDGSSIGTVAFLDSETLATAATVTSLTVNDPSKLIFICPALDAGTYILRITTYYTGGSSLLKNPRVIDSGTLTVEGEEEEAEETDSSSSEESTES